MSAILTRFDAVYSPPRTQEETVTDATLNAIFDRVSLRALRLRSSEIEVVDPFEDGVGTFHFHHGFQKPKFFTAELMSVTDDKKRVEIAVRAQGQRLNLVFETAHDAFVKGDRTSINNESTQKLMTMLMSLR
jgi:hypothetical protein